VYLNEQELLAIEAFAGHDAEQILANYIRLIDDNVSAIDEQTTKITETDPTYTKLQQVKDTLIEMKKESEPSLGNLERLLVLKEGFSH
jgi:prefoldin subunit 5